MQTGQALPLPSAFLVDSAEDRGPPHNLIAAVKDHRLSRRDGPLGFVEVYQHLAIRLRGDCGGGFHLAVPGLGGDAEGFLRRGLMRFVERVYGPQAAVIAVSCSVRFRRDSTSWAACRPS